MSNNTGTELRDGEDGVALADGRGGGDGGSGDDGSEELHFDRLIGIGSCLDGLVYTS